MRWASVTQYRCPNSFPMVAILVHVQPADSADGQHHELMNCSVTTSIQQIKAHIAKLGIESGRYTLPVEEQEMVFLEERCENEKQLLDYGINKDFIVQVTGFVVNPKKPGKQFKSGVPLEPCF